MVFALHCAFPTVIKNPVVTVTSDPGRPLKGSGINTVKQTVPRTFGDEADSVLVIKYKDYVNFAYG